MAYDTFASQPDSSGVGRATIRGTTHAASWLIAVLALLGLAGWIGGVPPVASLGPGFPPITPSSVLVLALLAMGLRALGGVAHSIVARRVVLMAGLFISVIAVVVIALQIESFGSSATRALRGTVLFHASPNSLWTAVSYLLLSAAMALATVKGRRIRGWSQLLALTVGGMAMVALVGLTIGIVRLEPSEPLVGMPLPVALALLAASFSVLVLPPRSSLMDLLDHDSPEAGLVRRLVPLAIGFPLLVAWLQALGQRLGWFQTVESEGVLTASMIVASMALILWTSAKLDEMNRSRSRARHRAETHRQWLEATLATIGDAVVTVNHKFHISYVNRAAETMLEVQRSTAVGRDINEVLFLVDETTCAPVGCPLRLAFARADRVTLEGESALRRKDGELQSVEVTAMPIRNSGEGIGGGVLVLRDVSVVRAREHAERKALANLDRRVTDRTRALDRTMSVLRESTTLLQTIAASTPEMIVAKGRDGRIMMVNPAALRSMGLSRAQVIGQKEEDLLDDPEAARRIVANDRSVLETGSPIAVEETRKMPSGERTYLVTKSPLRDDQDKVFGLVAVAMDITERKRAEQELEQLLVAEHRLRDEAERASRAKDEFLAIVSHELRSPLNALKGWSQVLSGARQVEPGLLGRAAEAITRNIDHQTRLIDDLLDTSRVISGKLDLNMQRLNLVEVLQPTVHAARDQALVKQIRLRFVSEQSEVLVDGDADRLQQVLSNLLSNAIKFTPEGGKIEVCVKLTPHWVELSVTDSGIGIARDFLPHVFDRFSQADTSMTRRYLGLGIGLALVRNLVELHGGSVHAASEGPGEGATFTVCLVPVRTAEYREARARPSPGGIGGVLRGTEVLLVDDDPDAREVMRLMLASAGVRVTTFESGEDFLNALAAGRQIAPLTILLLDIAMPGASGFEVLQRLRGMDSLPFLPALAVTALTHLDQSNFKHAGFQGCVGKPVDETTLVETIASVLKLDVRGPATDLDVKPSEGLIEVHPGQAPCDIEASRQSHDGVTHEAKRP